MPKIQNSFTLMAFNKNNCAIYSSELLGTLAGPKDFPFDHAAQNKTGSLAR